MKKTVAFFLFFVASMAFSQDTITAQQAKMYMGKEVVLTGRISSYRLASEGKTTNLINIDRAFPNHIFTIVVSTQYLVERKIDLERLKGKFVQVKGTISTYDKDPKKIPQIFNPSIFEIK